MTQRTSRRFSPKSLTAGRRNKMQRRAMLFESLEGRSLLATITGGTAIGGFEALSSASLLYQLSASSLVQGDGSQVTAWNNSGTAANNFTQASVAKQPTYVANSITLGNNMPAVSFDGTIAGWSGDPAVAPNADELVLSNSTAPATLFIVNSTSSTNGLDGIIGRDNGDFGIRRQSAAAWQHPGDGNDFSNPGALYVNGVAGTNPAVGLNTSHVLTATRPAGNTLAATSIGDYFQVGGNQPRSWGGQIGDVLAFNRSLGALERSIIENALAAKYNVTLAAGDLYAGDTLGSGNYDFGVFGIGGLNGNVAVGKAATQSSEFPGYPASLAVDGNTGNFTHTNSNDALASLTIDLGANNFVNDVLLYNRGGGCCPERLRDVTVELWTTNPTLGGSPVFTSPLLNPGNALNGPATIPVPTLTLGNPTSARWVVVRRMASPGGGDNNNVLSLGEVVVNASGPSSDLASAGQAGFGIEATAALGLGNTVLAGYKLAANSLVATDLPTGVDKRWDRAWYVDKTGAADARLAFDFSDAGLGAIPASTLGYQLLYSPNNNFESANSSFSVITATPTIVGDTISFAIPNASLQDGYYTLGLLDQATVLQANSTVGGDGVADAWRVVRSGGGVNLDFYQGATLVRSTPYASVTSISVVGSNDNDTFTVDQTGGIIAKPMNYTGNGQTSSPGDTLVISGGSATTVTHSFINNSDGSVNIDGTLINYTGLEPITDNMVVANRVFTFTGVAETITISNPGGVADGITRIDSTLGEFVDFPVPTTSLTINTNGSDVTNLNGFDPGVNTPTITFADASGTTSTVNVNTANAFPDVSGLSLTGNVNFNLNGFSETIGSLASTNATPVVTLTAAQALTVGDASNTTYAGTIVSGGSLVKQGAGTLTLSNKNPYTGGTTVNAGVLSLTSTANNGQSTVGTGDLVINAAGTVIAQIGDNQLGHTAAANIPNVVINGGVFTASSPFGGGMWFEGITMTGGTVNGTTGLNPQNAANSFLTTLAAATTATVSTPIANNKTNFVITVADGTAATDLLISNVISGVGGVQKEGLGTLSLTTFNTYTGGTIANGGTTLLGVGGGTGTIRGTLTVNTGATVDNTAANTFGFTAGQSVNVLNINGGTVGGADLGQHFWNNFALNMNAGTLRLGGTLNEFHNPIITVAAAATSSQILPVTAAAVFRMRDSTSPLFDVADGAVANDLVLSVPLTQNNTSNITKSGAGVMRYDAASSGFNTIFAAGGNLTIGGSGTHTIGNILPGASIADGARATGNGTLNIQDTAIINAGGLSINNQTLTVGIVNQSGGTLNISGGARIGHWSGVGTYNLSGGALNLTGTPTGVVNPAGVGEQNGVLYLGVDGSGVFTQTGGTFTGQGVVLDGRGDTAGVDTLTLNGGTMTLGASGLKAGNLDANTTYLINLGGGTLRASATWSSVLNAALTNAVGPALFDTNTFDISMSGVLSGAGALTKQGAGVLTLGGASSFAGNVLVSAGTLSVGDIANSGSNSNLGSGTAITLNGGTLRFNAAATDSSNRPITLGASHGGIEVSNAAGNITYSGGVAGGTNFTKFGAGQLTFSPATVAVGNLYISGGILTLAGSGTTTVTGTVLPGAAIGDGAQATGSGTLNVQGSVVLNAGGFSINNQSSTIGTVNQSGTSDVNIAGGFRIGHWPGGTGAYNISGGTLDVTGNPTGIVNPAGVGEQNGVIYLGVDGTGTMTISGTGAVTATGIVLDGRGNTGGTDTLTINGGLLRLGNNTNATTIAGSGIFTGNSNGNPSYQINLGGGGTLRSITPFSTPLAMNLTGTGVNAINVDTNGVNLTFTGVLSGAGGLAKSGAGNLLLTNTNTYADVTNVNGGTLQLQNGAAISDTAGAVSVGLGATLQLLNSETISSYVGAGDGVGSNDSLLALAANTLTTTGAAAIANVTTAAGGGIIAGTSITDNDDDNNVTGPDLYLQASTGIGTAANPIETAVASIQLNNTVSGDINILNSNAGALLTVANLRPLGFGAQNLGGATTIVNSSPLTIAANVISAGAVVLTATDSAAVGDNLAVNPGVTIQSTGSTVTLNAGDIATVPATTLLAAAGTVTVNIDAGVADPGVGGSLVFDGDVDAPLAVFNGSADTNGDSFDVRPDQDVGNVLTPIQVFGFAPIAGAYPVGDRLIVDIAGLGTPTLTIGPGARNGSFSFGALAASLTYNDIETVESDPPGATFHVVLDMRYSGFENGAADTILAQLNAAGDMLQLFVNAASVFEGADADIQSLTIIGSNDADSLTIQETAGGLPQFAGAAPAVNNTGIGGSTSNGSHLNASADLALETLVPGGTPWDANDVTFHFDAGTGNDSLTVNRTTSALLGYFSDTLDAGNSGNIVSPFTPFLLSFANVEPLALNGAGGGLITDATGTPATANLTITDIGTTTQIVGDGGFATTTYGGYTDLLVLGGTGSELIDLVSIDAAVLTLVRLVGGSTEELFSLPGGDASADTLRLRSLPATVQALLFGAGGSDTFQLYDAGNTVDNIAGNVTVDGTDGNAIGNIDTLTIINTGSANADAAVIAAVNPGASQDYFVDGVTAAVSTDVTFRNIDVLNYTATTFADSIDARLQNTTPTQHDLSTVNLSGWTGADQFLLFTSDQVGGTGAFNTPTGVASGVANVNLYGDALGNPNAGDVIDTFGATPMGVTGTGATNVGLLVADSTRMIRPSTSTAIAIDGGQPTGLAAPLGDVIGDTLNVDVSALPNATPVIVSTFSPGTVVATGISPLTWTQIEDLNLVDQGRLTNVQMGDLFARTTPNPDLIQITRNPTTLNPNQVRLRITASIGNYSVSNKTIMYGGGMNDTLTQSNLTIPAEFYGEAGDDYLSGAMNNDWLVGGDGNDRINGSGGDNVIWGDNAPTSADPTPQNALTGGDDQLSGLGGNDVFYGSGGNDLVSAGGGNDYVNGGAGNDTLDGHDGDDRIYGGAGNDVIGGHAGNDLLSGGDGEDRLYGAAGNDVILAGDGADLLDGGDGNDLLVNGILANESSTWTSVASTATYSAATYTNAGDNDAALLILLNQWGATSDGSSIGVITHDGDNDDLFGGTGDDDFCWETIDVQPQLTPADYNAFGMGTDQRIPPL